MKLIVSPEAAADLDRLRSFLANTNPSAAERAAAAIQRAIESLIDLPERGRPSGVREVREPVVPFGRSAYVLRYASLIESETVVILRIWHGREKR